MKQSGIDDDTWSDHTDVRPTMLLLSGLQDPYQSDGRVLVEGLQHSALPPSARGGLFQLLATAYKQLNAPLGVFGQATLKISTAALASGSVNDDSKYQSLESKLSALTAQRDAVATQIKTALDGAEFRGQPLDPGAALQLFIKAETILVQVSVLASRGL